LFYNKVVTKIKIIKYLGNDIGQHDTKKEQIILKFDLNEKIPLKLTGTKVLKKAIFT